MKNLISAAATAAAAVGLIAGCSTTAPKAAPPVQNKTQPPATPSPAPSTPSTTGAIGTTFQITDTEAGANGNQTAVYDVTAQQVVDPAPPDNSFDAAPAGQHLVAVELTIKGLSGNESDDANNDAVVQGSNGQDYPTGDGGVAAGTNFNSGQFNTAPGTSVTGWVNFDVPNGVTVSSVQWTPDSGEGSVTVNWTTNGS
jgi:hypothetical protein